jgi:hypothetical protein
MLAYLQHAFPTRAMETFYDDEARAIAPDQ